MTQPSVSHLRALPGLLTPSAAYKPFRYPWAYDFWKRQQQVHWMPEEVPLGEDLKDWATKLNDRERKALGLEQLPKNLHDAIKIAEDSELLAETLGEHVYEFFLRNKRAEWEEYRGQVSAFERDRMLPVI